MWLTHKNAKRVEGVLGHVGLSVQLDRSRDSGTGSKESVDQAQSAPTTSRFGQSTIDARDGACGALWHDRLPDEDSGSIATRGKSASCFGWQS